MNDAISKALASLVRRPQYASGGMAVPADFTMSTQNSDGTVTGLTYRDPMWGLRAINYGSPWATLQNSLGVHGMSLDDITGLIPQGTKAADAWGGFVQKGQAQDAAAAAQAPAAATPAAPATPDTSQAYTPPSSVTPLVAPTASATTWYNPMTDPAREKFALAVFRQQSMRLSAISLVDPISRLVARLIIATRGMAAVAAVMALTMAAVAMARVMAAATAASPPPAATTGADRLMAAIRTAAVASASGASVPRRPVMADRVVR